MLIVPNPIEPDSTADANELDQNFDVIQSYINNEVIQRDGSVAMANPLQLAPGNPTAAGHAANKGYVDTKHSNQTDYIDQQDATRVKKAGDTMSGDLQIGGAPGTQDGILFTEADGAGWFSSSRENAPIVAIKLRGAGASTNGAIFVRFTNSDNENVCGSITKPNPGNVAYNTSSASALKERSGDANEATEHVTWLGARVYVGYWVDDPAQLPWYLVNAEDVQQVAPELVSATEGMLQLNTPGLIPMMLAAISQLSERVAALEA